MTVSTRLAPRALIRLSATLAILATPMVAAADSVVLKSYDGTTEMHGNLLDYSDGIFTLGTPLGDVLIPARLMACDGEACPSARVVIRDLQANGDMMITEGVLQDAASPVFCPLTNAEIAS